MLALERTPYRLYPLPPIYNFRRFTVSSLYNIQGPARPVIARTSIFRQIAESVHDGTIGAEAAEALQNYFLNTALHSVMQTVTQTALDFKNRV